MSSWELTSVRQVGIFSPLSPRRKQHGRFTSAEAPINMVQCANPPGVHRAGRGAQLCMMRGVRFVFGSDSSHCTNSANFCSSSVPLVGRVVVRFVFVSNSSTTGTNRSRVSVYFEYWLAARDHE